MAREDPQLKLRLPADLKQRISEAAETNNRSINAEIVRALEIHFPPPPEPGLILTKLDWALSLLKKNPQHKEMWGYLDRHAKELAALMESSGAAQPKSRKLDLGD